MVKVIVAGGRNFQDYALLKAKLDKILHDVNDSIEIVCGEANGADTLGKQYAIENHYRIASFPANWDKNGKAAGFIRNEEMAKYSTHCVCFWDKKSKGTKHMIDLANQYKLKLRVINY